MDKETLSNYGWIVICVLVLAVMLGLATPFGSFISTAVKDTTAGLFATNQKALDIAGIPIANQSFNTTDENGKAKLEVGKPTKIDEDTTTLVVGNKEIPVDMPAGTVIDMDEDGNATATVPSKEPEVPATPAPTVELINFTIGELKTVVNPAQYETVEYDEYYEAPLYPSVIVTKSVALFSINESTGEVIARPATLDNVQHAGNLGINVNGVSIDYKPDYIAYRTISNDKSLSMKGVNGNTLEFSYSLQKAEDTKDKVVYLAAYEKKHSNASLSIATKNGSSYTNDSSLTNKINSITKLTETKTRKATKQVKVSPSSTSTAYIPTGVLTAEKGMTWNQWIGSKYNTADITNDTIIKSEKGNIINKSETIVQGSKYVIVKDTTANDIIPVGGKYTIKATNTTLEGNGINTFPETPADGDKYEEGDYVYKYNQYYYYNSWSSDSSQNGWGVRVKDTSKTSYGDILSEIAGQPVKNMFYTFYNCTSLTTAPTIPSRVTNMYQTFYNCTSLTTAPTIPNSVTNMTYTFYGCTSLTIPPDMSNASSVTNMTFTFGGCTSLATAPTIPNSVTNMWGTFSGCTSLTGTIEVNANPTECYECFKNTQITGITGSCTQTTKNNLMKTKK